MQFDHFRETFIHLPSSDWSISEDLAADWAHRIACPRFSLPQSIDILSFFVFGNKKAGPWPPIGQLASRDPGAGL